MDEGSFPEQDPRPDEDAWEAYLNFVRPFMDASDDRGLDNTELSELEKALDAKVPFEVGLLLVMGVPSNFPWRNWKSDPVAQLADWNDEVCAALGLDAGELDAAPRLLPIYANVAVPLVAVDDACPLYRIDPSGVAIAGLDLADWLHKEFDLPLPWWPDNQPDPVPFWTERLD